MTTIKSDINLSLPEKEVSEIDKTTEQERLARIAVKKNNKATVNFTMAFTTKMSMNVI
jgi:hypothetical protein